jgi:hypothetical protein
VEGDGASGSVSPPDEQQRAAATDGRVNTRPDSEPGFEPDMAPPAHCQMSGAGSAAATAAPRPRWHSRLVGMAAVVRAYLGLGGDSSGPAGAFDELGAGMYDCQMSVGGRLKGIGGRVTLRLRVRQSTDLASSVERGNPEVSRNLDQTGSRRPPGTAA